MTKESFAEFPGGSGATTRGPVTGAERIVSIDVLRGFALLGILVVNIQSFSMISAAYFNPTAYGDLTGANRLVWLGTHVFFDQKFMTIFSMLFGAGIVLLADRIESRGGRPGALHYRRMAWLTVIGLLHAHLLWYGDILYFYGICGMLVYPLRRLSVRTLIVVGLCTVAVASLLWIASGLSMAHWPAEDLEAFRQDWHPDAAAVDEELATYRGGWLEQMSHRVPSAMSFETGVFLFWGLWRAGGLMLIGMALFRMGVFGAGCTRRFYTGMVAAGVFVGLPLVLTGAYKNVQSGWDVGYSFFLGSQFNYWGSLPVSLGLVGAVMLAFKNGFLPGLSRALAAVGRTALTNYLLQTVICTTLFYGHGLGLFGKIERAGQLLIVLAVLIVQLVASPMWLARFRFGPAEWLWRTLTYAKLQRMRRS